MNQTSRVLLALAVFLSIGCRKVAIDVGDNSSDGGPDSASTGGRGGEGLTGGGPGGSGGQKSSSSLSGRTEVTILQAPMRQVDVLFVVDNSPSMDPKQQALAQTFPKMVEALQNVPGGMPDLHIGVVSTDVGAGAGEAGGNCGVVLGNQGILWGNDVTIDPSLQNNKYATVANINNGCGMNTGARWIQDTPGADGISRSKNYRGNLTDVFSCLAKAVGVGGCGYEHTLQSLRVALTPADNINAQNKGFLRPKANLAIVIVSDEDDCSADPNTDTNDAMFFPRTIGDTASVRCAARGHVCNGKAIPNYDPATGYASQSPFVANLADCEAKDDDTLPGRNYKELPLIRIRDIIDKVKASKPLPNEQIMVAGIIGWPENGDLSGVQYRIDKDSTSMPREQQNLWDYMPICSRPDVKSADGNIYKAYGALRLKKFIDGFGENGLVYSICNTGTFANVMQQIGNAMARRMKPGCFVKPLVDSNPDLPETQPECTVMDTLMCYTPGQDLCLTTGYTETELPQCIDPTTGNPLSPTAPALDNIPDSYPARPCWYLVHDTDPITGCPEAPFGQRIKALRLNNVNTPEGSLLKADCRTCESISDLRCASL